MSQLVAESWVWIPNEDDLIPFLRVDLILETSVNGVSDFPSSASGCILPCMKATPKTPALAIKQMQLAELACRVVPHDGETDEQIVRRALGIWKAAGEVLAENPAGEKAVFSFTEVANQSLLPSRREKTEFVGTGKGVEQAVRKFFDEVLAGFDRAMKGRFVNDSVLRENKQALKKMRDEVLAQREVSSDVLEQLRQYQNQCRGGSFSVTVETIRCLLGGVDVGRPGLEV